MVDGPDDVRVRRRQLVGDRRRRVARAVVDDDDLERLGERRQRLERLLDEPREVRPPRCGPGRSTTGAATARRSSAGRAASPRADHAADVAAGRGRRSAPGRSGARSSLELRACRPGSRRPGAIAEVSVDHVGDCLQGPGRGGSGRRRSRRPAADPRRAVRTIAGSSSSTSSRRPRPARASARTASSQRRARRVDGPVDDRRPLARGPATRRADEQPAAPGRRRASPTAVGAAPGARVAGDAPLRPEIAPADERRRRVAARIASQVQAMSAGPR